MHTSSPALGSRQQFSRPELQLLTGASLLLSTSHPQNNLIRQGSILFSSLKLHGIVCRRRAEVSDIGNWQKWRLLVVALIVDTSCSNRIAPPFDCYTFLVIGKGENEGLNDSRRELN